MKKIIAMLLATVMVCLALTACGAGKPYDYDLSTYLKAADYKTITLDKSRVESDIQDQIDSVIAQYKEEKEREGASETGDVITYNVNAKVDGEANEALTADGNLFTVGTTKTDFEEVNNQLNSGLKKGDVRDITVTVPDDYKDETLRGKTAELTISVTAIKYTYLPELTDEMVNESTNGKYTTVADYKAYLEVAVPQGLAFEQVMEKTEFISYPEKEAEEYYELTVANYQNTAAQYGMTLDQLVSMYGEDTASFFNSLAQDAVTSVNREMLIYYIYRTEGLTVTEEMKDFVIADLLASYGYETEKEMRKAISDESLEVSYVYEAVLRYLTDNIEYTETATTEAAE